VTTTLFDLLFIAALFAPPIVLVVSATALAFGRRQHQPEVPVMRRAA
jgi:hypothetical protein